MSKKERYWVVSYRDGNIVDVSPIGESLEEARKSAKEIIENSGNTKYDYIDEVVILKEIETIYETDIE